MTRAVVFAYHDVGVSCLSSLLAAKVDVPLVVTHEDDPRETVWFGSVAALARRHGIPVIAPRDAKDEALARRVAELAPDFVFSFYYRRLLPEPLLHAARRGAFNVHGSLLPRYRGRAPVNWAIARGETATGATLHHMIARPDAGPIVAQEAFPILPDENARDVHVKLAAAAARLVARTLPALIDGSAKAVPQDESLATSFGRRRPADGAIDWTRKAAEVHDLVRAVAPPYPGAFGAIGGTTYVVHRTAREATRRYRSAPLCLHGDGDACFAVCGDGRTLRLLEASRDGAVFDLAALARRIASRPLPLTAP